MYTQEIPALVTVLGTVFTLLGVTGIDPTVLTQAVTGFIAFVTIITSVWAFVNHHKMINTK